MTNKSNEERIERLEKIVRKQHEILKEQHYIIKRLVNALQLNRNGRNFVYGKGSDSAERYRPHGGGKVYNSIAEERTRPWGSGNT